MNLVRKHPVRTVVYGLLVLSGIVNPVMDTHPGGIMIAFIEALIIVAVIVAGIWILYESFKGGN